MKVTELLHDVHNYSASLDSREIFLHNYYGGSSDDENPGVEYKMSNIFLKNLRSMQLKSHDPITIHMHSIGGEWADGMAMYDAISMSKCYITIIAYGQVESMSSIIYQAADARWITPNAHFMVHYGSTDAAGEYQSVQNWVKYEKHICDTMLDIYAQSCIGGKFFKEKYNTNDPQVSKVKNFLVTKLKSGDWYMTAAESVDYGFADRIITQW
tara:strand:+ start:246 stop:881 length:636 start_codon:yes stop_codon:yes gene_type:complete